MKTLLALLLSLTFTSAEDSRPNIILLFADDAGYGDFGFHGSKHFQTPHLDKLAESGVRFSQFYVTGATCGPSRAGMLSGMYQQRFGFEEINVPGIMSERSKLLGDEMGLPTDLKTMGNYLQDLGYHTGVFGKWHMGIADRYHPLKRGFDEFYGFRGGARSFFPLTNPTPKDQANLMERNFAEFQEHEGYLTDVLGDETADFIERNKEKPFFAYVSFTAVHTPMQAAKQDQDKFPDLEGIRRTAAQMTLSMDRACGQIIAKLDELGLRENTIVVFTNDNGGPMDKNGSSNYPFAGVKGTQLEGGVRVPGLISWPAKLPKNSVYEKPSSTLDLIPTFIAAGGGKAETPENLDGVNLLPYLADEKKEAPHPILHWKMETRGAMREGDWKFIRYPDRPAELFNLANDPGEQSNLAVSEQKRLKEMFAKHFEWEMTLERPLFLLRRQEEGWSARRANEFRHPPAQDY